MADVKVIQRGANKPQGGWPYTLCIVANCWIESPENSGAFVADPITRAQTTFDLKAAFIIDAIFGRLHGQAETMFADLAADIRVLTIFDSDRPRKDANALVAHDNTNIVIARQKKMAAFLKTFHVDGMGALRADVAFAVTGSATHDRSSAWFTLDNDGAAGRPFTVDDQDMVHRHENTMPGAVALHTSAASIVPLHEFAHAASSWTNGMIGDLYIDVGDVLNKRRGRPVNPAFCLYDGTPIASAPNRGGGLTYPDDWYSYHPELSDPTVPAVMDDSGRRRAVRRSVGTTPSPDASCWTGSRLLCPVEEYARGTS